MPTSFDYLAEPNGIELSADISASLPYINQAFPRLDITDVAVFSSADHHLSVVALQPERAHSEHARNKKIEEQDPHPINHAATAEGLGCAR